MPSVGRKIPPPMLPTDGMAIPRMKEIQSNLKFFRTQSISQPCRRRGSEKMNRDVREQSSVVFVQRSLTGAARKIDGDGECQPRHSFRRRAADVQRYQF